MKICFMCDLHLSYNKKSVQYDVLEWAAADMLKKGAELFVFAGDFTADGNIFAAKRFMKKVLSLGIPYVVIPGNSDCRTPNNIEKMKNNASTCLNKFDNLSVIAICDCLGTVTDEELYCLENAENGAVAVMHHPPEGLKSPYKEKLASVLEKRTDISLFYGHLHKSFNKGNIHSLQAADPDKAIGENPCITYFDTESKELRKSYYFCPIPPDIYDYIGISCFDPIEDIDYAKRHGLKCIELRPGAVKCDRTTLVHAVNGWRDSGGSNLSLHAPDLVYKNGTVVNCDEWDDFLSLASALSPDRITLHTPDASVEVIRKNKNSLENISSFLAGRFSVLPEKCVIGIENMHMTAKDNPGNSRRFGYIPEECIEFMKYLQNKCPRNIGINLDTGHARNNAPFSQKYPVGTWYAETGRFTVGYHIHQVLNTKDGFVNHMPVTEPYGSLISYASFFKSWSFGNINKAPIIFEIRGHGAYSETIELFEKMKQRQPFDLHSHTYYSNCGRDKPEILISKAIENGIVTFGICDHNYGIAHRKTEYCMRIRELSAKYSDKIKLLCGIEIATLPHLFDITDYSEIANYDYCLLEQIDSEDSVSQGNLIGFCKKLGIRCGIAHTDLFAYCKKFGYDPKVLFKELADNGIFWEMNVSFDSIHGYREHRYVKDFMLDETKQEIVKNSGLYISVGFDSHRYEDYDGFKVHEMYDFLVQKGIKTADKLFS